MTWWKSLVWVVEFSDDAIRELKKLNKQLQQRITTFLVERVQNSDNPRATGKALQGKLASYWRYRVGDYRLICHIKDGELIVLIIEIGHRKDIYR